MQFVVALIQCLLPSFIPPPPPAMEREGWRHISNAWLIITPCHSAGFMSFITAMEITAAMATLQEAIKYVAVAPIASQL